MLTKGAVTTVVTVALLLARFASACAPIAVAVELRVPLVVVRAVIVIVALAPVAKLPTFQMRVLLEIEVVPCVGVEETTATLAGSVSLTITLVAGLGPRLVTDPISKIPRL